MLRLSNTLLTLALLLPAALPAAPACTLRVRQHSDPLVLTLMPNGERSGPQVETLREAARRIGCQIQLLPMPWARALVELQAGRLDVLPDAHRVPEREAYALFSSSTWPSSNRVFMRVDALQRADAPTSLAQLLTQGRRLGVQVGVRYGGEADRLLNDPRFASQLVRAPNRKGLWQMLALGRVDGIIADDGSGRRELHRLGLTGQLAPAAITIEDQPSHTAFSRATVSPELVARLDAALASMRKDGSAAAIEERFKAP